MNLLPVESQTVFQIRHDRIQKLLPTFADVDCLLAIIDRLTSSPSSDGPTQHYPKETCETRQVGGLTSSQVAAPTPEAGVDDPEIPPFLRRFDADGKYHPFPSPDAGMGDVTREEVYEFFKSQKGWMAMESAAADAVMLWCASSGCTPKPAEIDRGALAKFYYTEMKEAMTGAQFADKLLSALPGMRGKS